MKNVLLITAAIMVVAGSVLAKMPKINVGGEIRVRAEEINNLWDFKNYDPTTGRYDDKDSHVIHRVRVNLDAEVSDGIGAYVSLEKPEDMSWWGVAGPTSLNDLQDNVSLRHAYLTIDDVAGLVDLSLGRQGIGVVDRELVLFADTEDDNPDVATALDLIKARAKFGNLSLTGLCAKEEETLSGNTDTNIQGIIGEANLDILRGINLTGYLLRRVIEDPNNSNVDKNNCYGAKVSGSLDIASALNYSAEYVKQNGGTPTDRDAHAYRVALGYSTDVEGLGALEIEGSYLKMSGTSGDTYAPEVYTGINPDIDYYAICFDYAWWGGIIFPWGRKDININAKITPEAIENLTLGISYTSFSTDKKAIDYNNKTHLGSELDLSCSYKYSDKTQISFTYGRFSPGDLVAEFIPNPDVVTLLRCDLLTKF